MAITLAKFPHLEIGTLVKERVQPWGIGWVASQPYTAITGVTVVDVDYVDLSEPAENGLFETPPGILELATPRCECGNPFRLCHPEA